MGQAKAIEIMYGIIQRMTYEEIVAIAKETDKIEEQNKEKSKAG
ncbi:hypothetical protein Ga0466249_001915 [Sporomusaceae bacterium BoRhaA]|nr:hypothetical protein [Pelorhabdus rhamnosifermentans]MBU2700810.1 hypothetical protein [Pelorhabdus rhamnosifermentans]